jgi:hypothetical protein
MDSNDQADQSGYEARDKCSDIFFAIRGRDRVENDPDGVCLPDVNAALSYAEYTIRELRKRSGYNPALMMVVQDQAQQTVLSLPFFPGN